MAIIEDALSSTALKIEPTGAAKTVLVARGDGYFYSGITGTVAAALAAGAAIFVMRVGAGATKQVFIDRIRIQYTCLAAFTAAVTAGRRLELRRANGATATSGGTGVASGAVQKKDTTVSSNSVCDLSNAGDVRIATTGALTVTGATYDPEPIGIMSLSHVGAVGNFFEQVFEFSTSESSEIILNPNQLLAIRTPVAMDAGGTWQASIRVDWREI